MTHRSRGQNIKLIDFMGWMTGDVSGRGNRSKTPLGSAKRPTGRSVHHGVRQRQEQYDAKRISGFSSEDVDEFRQIFEFYDIDNTKTMDIGDLDVALRALGYNPTLQEIEEVTQLMDVDGDSTFDFSEFCMLIEHITEERGEYGELREAFRCLDHNDDGFILADDLIRMLTTHSEEMTLKEINEMIKFAKKNESGLIDYEEFVGTIRRMDKMLKRQNAAKKLLQNFIVSTQQSNILPTLPSSLPSPGGSKRPSHDKKIASQNDGLSRNVETVDTLIKALGGPILLTSAIIITASTPRKRKLKWPSLRRVLGLSKNNSRPRLLEQAMVHMNPK